MHSHCYAYVLSLVQLFEIPPGSSLHGISQARIPEWVAISFSRRFSCPGIEPLSPALAGGFFTAEPPEKPCCAYVFTNKSINNNHLPLLCTCGARTFHLTGSPGQPSKGVLLLLPTEEGTRVESQYSSMDARSCILSFFPKAFF